MNSIIVVSIAFKNGTNMGSIYVYNVKGNLIKDFNRNIVGIQYNILNLPCRIQFEDGNSISYLYDANGVRLCTTHIIGSDTTRRKGLKTEEIKVEL